MYNKLQYISQGATPDEQWFNIQTALDNGCQWIQLRYKNGTNMELSALAATVKKHCEQYAATFIINDNPELVKQIDADGVHLGLQDMSVTEARSLLGTAKIIGGTANTFEDIEQRFNEQCDYIGLGPYRFTTTKQQLSPVLGVAGYQSLLSRMKTHNINIPVYAIGGITMTDIPELMATGVYGIAVSGLITLQDNKKELLTQLNQQLYGSF